MNDVRSPEDLTRRTWCVTDRPPEYSGWYWITRIHVGKTWVMGPHEYHFVDRYRYWPSDAIAYMKLEPRPDPFHSES